MPKLFDNDELRMQPVVYCYENLLLHVVGMRIDETKKVLLERRKQICDWLSNEAPYTTVDQLHLESHSPEQAYWHFGYERALSDVLDLITETDGHSDDQIDNEGRSKPSQLGG